MDKMDEIILVAPRKDVFNNEELTFQGVLTDKEKVKTIVENIANTYTNMRRGDAEENIEFKQPIPYVVLKKGDKVFAYKRLTGGGEARLHNLMSLGVGGHCNDVEGLDFYSVLKENLQRELQEELYINENDLSLNTIGLINDDLNEVGKVHIGMLVIAELANDTEVSVRETDQLKGEWFEINELKQPEIYQTLETWSQFVVDTL